MTKDVTSKGKVKAIAVLAVLLCAFFATTSSNAAALASSTDAECEAEAGPVKVRCKTKESGGMCAAGAGYVNGNYFAACTAVDYKNETQAL